MALLRAVDEATALLVLGGECGPAPSALGTETALARIAASLHERDWILPGAPPGAHLGLGHFVAVELVREGAQVETGQALLRMEPRTGRVIAVLHIPPDAGKLVLRGMAV